MIAWPARAGSVEFIHLANDDAKYPANTFDDMSRLLTVIEGIWIPPLGTIESHLSYATGKEAEHNPCLLVHDARVAPGGLVQACDGWNDIVAEVKQYISELSQYTIKVFRTDSNSLGEM